MLRTLALEEGSLDLWLALNDNIADGRDVSWVWDADFELLAGRTRRVTCSGTRAEEMALRLKYAGVDADPVVDRDLESSLASAVADRDGGRPLFALPTYTAMLEMRGALARRGPGPEVVGVSTMTTDGLAIAWHDAECGSYAADLPLWRELAADAGGPVLDLGCGSGRVALDLAAARARGDRASTPRRRWSARCATGRATCRCRRRRRRRPLAGPRPPFPLAIAPMQVVQLMGGPAGRAGAAGVGARVTSTPGARFALALADPFEELPPRTPSSPSPTCARRTSGCSPASRWRCAWRSTAWRSTASARRCRPQGELTEELVTIALDHLSPDELEAEAAEHGYAAPAAAAGRGHRGLRGQHGRGAGARVSTLRVGALYPELMNIYADRGNIAILRARCEWRGIGFELGAASIGDELDPERPRPASTSAAARTATRSRCREDMAATKRDAMHAAAERGASVLAVCGGYQLLGHSYELGDEHLPGVGLVDLRPCARRARA